MKLGRKISSDIAELGYLALYRKTLWVEMCVCVSMRVYNQVEVRTWDKVRGQVGVVGGFETFEIWM